MIDQIADDALDHAQVGDLAGVLGAIVGPTGAAVSVPSHVAAVADAVNLEDHPVIRLYHLPDGAARLVQVEAAADNRVHLLEAESCIQGSCLGQLLVDGSGDGDGRISLAQGERTRAKQRKSVHLERLFPVLLGIGRAYEDRGHLVGADIPAYESQQSQQSH